MTIARYERQFRSRYYRYCHSLPDRLQWQADSWHFQYLCQNVFGERWFGHIGEEH